MAFHKLKKDKCWIIKAYDRLDIQARLSLGLKTVTFRRLYEKVQYLDKCLIFRKEILYQKDY